MTRHSAICILLAISVWGGGTNPCQAGAEWTYRGLDWMISAASDIVVATEVPQEPQQISLATGKPVISSLPDVANGIKWNIIIQHVLKGKLKTGEHVDVYLPITEYIGNHPVEFPMDSASFMLSLRSNSVILFLHRTGNKISLETLPCFGSTILADPDTVTNFKKVDDIKENILGLIEQNPQHVNPLFTFGESLLATQLGATIYETGSASLYDALKDPYDVAVIAPYMPGPANWKSGLVKVTGRIRCDMHVGTTFTATLDSGLPTNPSENYLVFLAPLKDFTAESADRLFHKAGGKNAAVESPVQ